MQSRSILVFLSLLFAGTAHAQTPITLPEALALVSQQAPAGRRSALAVDHADAGIREARAVTDPTLSADANAQSQQSTGFLAGTPLDTHTSTLDQGLTLAGTSTVGTTWELYADLDYNDSTSVSQLLGGEQKQSYWTSTVGVQVKQDVLAPWRSAPGAVAVRQAVERRDQASLDLLGVRQDTLTSAASAWWELRLAQDRLALAEARLRTLQALESRTEARVEEGLVEALERDRVTVDRLQGAREVIAARDALDRASDTLAVLLGLPLEEKLVPTGDGVLDGAETLDLEAHLAWARTGNVDLAKARLQRDIARSSQRDARQARAPTLTLIGTGSVGSLETDVGDAITGLAKESAFPTYGAGLQFAVPLAGRAAAAQVDAAGAEVVRADLLLEDADRQVESEVRSAVRSVISAREDVELAAARVAVARRTEDAEQVRVEEGTKRLDQLLEAGEARQSAELDHLDAVIALARAQLELRALEGALTAPEPVR